MNGGRDDGIVEVGGPPGEIYLLAGILFFSYKLRPFDRWLQSAASIGRFDRLLL